MLTSTLSHRVYVLAQVKALLYAYNNNIGFHQTTALV